MTTKFDPREAVSLAEFLDLPPGRVAEMLRAAAETVYELQELVNDLEGDTWHLPMKKRVERAERVIEAARGIKSNQTLTLQHHDFDPEQPATGYVVEARAYERLAKAIKEYDDE